MRRRRLPVVVGAGAGGAVVRQLLPTYDDSPDLLALYADAPERYVRGGFVLSTDGGAVVDGGSRRLSSPPDREVFRTLRGLCDVILVGAGTTRVEDYGRIRLPPAAQAWRAARGLPPLPRVAVVSRSGAIDPRVFGGGRPLLVTCGQGGDSQGERADVVVAGRQTVDLGVALDALADRGLTRVLCEGGPTLLAGVVAAGRLDELCLTSTPLLLGPAPGLLPTLSTGPVRLALRTLLESDGTLFARYDVLPGGAG